MRYNPYNKAFPFADNKYTSWYTLFVLVAIMGLIGVFLTLDVHYDIISALKEVYGL